MLDILQRLVAQTGVAVSPQQAQQLVTLVEQLNKWNKAYNLTSVRDPRQMLSRHIIDSIVIQPFLRGQRFIDVGTGPGLPGLPLAIIMPDCHFTLLDSLGKRIRFIRQFCHENQITNVTAVQSRVEDFEPQQKFDGVISRAFASLNDMLSWCHHLPTEQGCFYALKGQYPTAELAQLPAAFQVEQIEKLQVPEADGERHLVLIKAAK